VVGVPNEFARDWIESRFSDVLREAVSTVMSADVGVRVVIDERAADEAAARPDGSDPQAPTDGGDGPTGNPIETDGAEKIDAAGLNPRYTFDRWVVGPHNEYATAIARSVADAPGTAYNPVFLYAGTGLGKTHLVQAIAHELFGRRPVPRVKYVTCEQFTDDFISGVSEKGRIEGFKQQYRTNDVLIIDDVQFLAGKQGTQVEFFNTFNALYEADRQIVLTSDRQPRELEELDDRLRSRFGQGVVVDIGRPDVETRIAILRRQVKVDGYNVRDPEVLEYIASQVSSNIRELVGALRRVVSYASITHSEVSLDLAREALKDLLPPVHTRQVTIDAVQSEVARQFGCHVSDLRGDKRTADIAYARHVAMYLCRELTEASLPQIGDRFGGRDHSTVLYGVNRVSRLLTDGHDRQLHDLIQVVTNRLQAAR